MRQRKPEAYAATAASALTHSEPASR